MARRADLVTADLVTASAERLQELQDAQQLAAGVATPSRLSQGPATLSTLRERLGRGRDLLRKPAEDESLFPTALPAVDPLLAGGVARGCLTELRGAPSSGRFGLVLALLAATTARGEAVALVDLGDQLDPQEAADCGVVLPRLLWARPSRLREALAAAEIALGGDFPLVVLELGMPPLPYGTGDEHAWLRLARAARLHHSALVVATPWRITGSAAGEVLALTRRGGVWIGSGAAPRLLAGVEARLVREKSRRQADATQPAAALGLRAPALLGPLPKRTSAPRGTRLLPPARPASPPRRERERGVPAPLLPVPARRPASPTLLPVDFSARCATLSASAAKASAPAPSAAGV